MSGTDNPAEAFKEEFAKFCEAATEKKYLPSATDLILGMPFFGNSFTDDVTEFVNRTSSSLASCEAAEPLVRFLSTLVDDLGLSMIQSIISLLKSMPLSGDYDHDELTNRMDLYAAFLGCEAAAFRVALTAASLGMSPLCRPRGSGSTFFGQALGWMLVMDDYYEAPEQRRSDVEFRGGRVIYAILAENGCFRNVDLTPSGGRTSRLLKSQAERKQKHVDDDADGPGIIVISEIGNRNSSEGKRVAREWSSFLGKRLPLIPVPNLRNVRNVLRSEYPFAHDVIDKLLTELATQTTVSFRPIVLVGSPGIGKSAFAMRLFQALEVPCMTYACGGVSDSSLAGTPRRYSTGEPSLVVSTISRYECASPGIVLDEIEKVGDSRHNGNVLDALLGLLEPQTSRAWMDPYLEAPIDASRVLWIATANSISELPGPLKDRCRFLSFPEPRPEDLPALGARMLEQLAQDRGLDPRWHPELTQEELDVLSRYWKGGSLRKLRKLIEGVLAVRERERLLN